jgi:Alr-MurF fusion protein
MAIRQSEDLRRLLSTLKQQRARISGRGRRTLVKGVFAVDKVRRTQRSAQLLSLEFGRIILKPITLEHVAKVTYGQLCGRPRTPIVNRVCIDSRGVSRDSLFVALKGTHTDGHLFLADAFRNGASAALVADSMTRTMAADPEWPLIKVESPLISLQRLASWYRQKTFDRVVTITGSNGKTIVKDALRTMLPQERVIASPGSYNSQLGLPLAILGADKTNCLAVLEVGISSPGEMSAQRAVAQPDYGILTNIGLAHIAAFGSRDVIAAEKMQLFTEIPTTGWVIAPADEPLLDKHLALLKCDVHRLGSTGSNTLSFEHLTFIEGGQILRLRNAAGVAREVRIQTRSPHVVWNILCACTAAILLGTGLDTIAAALEDYVPCITRMEMWSSHEGVRIINDAHSSDPISVRSALQATALIAPAGRKIFAFGGMRELAGLSEIEHRQVGAQAAANGFSDLLLLETPDLRCTAEEYVTAQPSGTVTFVPSVQEMRNHLRANLQAGDTVLVKGPRHSGLIQLARDICGLIAQRCLWVSMERVEENLARLRRHCGHAGIIATIKALAYGTNLSQLAAWMSNMGVRHLGVSTTSEGVAIRKAGADQEILVFLADRDDASILLQYQLTPIIYSFELFESLHNTLTRLKTELNVHLKIDTGMHRAGLLPQQAIEVATEIMRSKYLHLSGLCTHFAAADDPASDDLTRHQIDVFNQTIAPIRHMATSEVLVHAANTAAAIRFPQAHYDLVRVGLALYGVYPSDAVRNDLVLQLAVGVTSRVASIRSFPPGVRLGYNGTFTTTRPSRIAIVPFGYADGLPWSLSGRGWVLAEGNHAQIVGRVSMDQIQIDVTDIDIDVGAEVLLYGAHSGHVIRPEAVAQAAGTIPHELLARLGPRVERIFSDI